MKILFKALFKISVVLLTFTYFFTGCGVNEGNTTESNAESTSLDVIQSSKPPDFSPQEYISSPTEDNVKLLGRSYYDGEKRYFSYSGSGVEFSFVGEYAEFTLYCENIDSLSYNHYPRYSVLLNGEILEQAVIDTLEKHVTVTTSAADEPAVVTLIKESEAKFSGFSLGSIKTFGKIGPIPTAANEFKIEFIGDSLTCGYGIDEADPEGMFSTHTESFTGTYAYRTARMLSADFSAVCFSGYGIATGYTESGKKYSDSVVSKYYSTAAFLPDGTEPYWNFSGRDSDVVVLNLGTNDAVYCQSSSRRSEFIDNYIVFLEAIRMANPKAYILCVLGDVNNSVYPLIEAAAAEYSENSLDYNVGTAMITFNMGDNDIVVDGHPGYLSNASAAQSLTDIINELISQGKVG